MQTANNKTDARILFAVLACLSAGAGLTYWLANAASEPEKALPVRHGRALNAPRENAGGSRKMKETLEALAQDDGRTYRPAGFDILASYYYETLNPDVPAANLLGEPRKNQIPKPIKELDGKKISVQGFMMHLKGANGSCSAFLLVRDQNICCFRRTPRLNELISVTMKAGKTTPLIMNQAITVFGTLHVGEQIENGTVVGLYRLDADDVAGPVNM